MSERIRVRPFLPKDTETLETYRRSYEEANIVVPLGYEFPPVCETAVAVRPDGTIIAALMKTLIATLDPFISDPGASQSEKAAALRWLSRSLEYQAQKDGAAEVFTAVPERLLSYQQVLENNGWERTAQNCVIFRKSLIGGNSPPES